jgi:hypothetical protein
VLANRDQCHLGSWIFAKSLFAVQTVDRNVPPIIGKITEILQDINAASAWAVVDIFSIEKERHRIYGMPVLSRQLNEVSTAVISITVRDLSGFW